MYVAMPNAILKSHVAVYIVIHDLDCFVLLCIDIRLNTLSVFITHELDSSWVKIVTTGVASIKHGPKARESQH